jgi:hypothetical protein
MLVLLLKKWPMKMGKSLAQLTTKSAGNTGGSKPIGQQPQNHQSQPLNSIL